MDRLQLRPDYRSAGRVAVFVRTPWDRESRLLLRLPEAVSCDGKHLFAEWNRSEPWPSAQPVALPEWRAGSADGSLTYTCSLTSGITFRASVTPARDTLDLSFAIRNDTEEPLRQISANMCMSLAEAPEFCDRQLARTRFLHAGNPRLFNSTTPEPASMQRPPWIHCQVRGIAPFDVPPDCPWWVCRERADDGLIFVESTASRRYVALIWGKALSIVANSLAPCIHSNPRLPDCPPGEEVEQRGRVLLNEGKVDLLCFRALDGFE